VLFSFAEGEKHLNFSADLHYKVGPNHGPLLKANTGPGTAAVNLHAQGDFARFVELSKQFLPADSAEMIWMAIGTKIFTE
jgi:hypothetical protein